MKQMKQHTFQVTETMTYRLSVDLPETATPMQAAQKAQEIWDGMTHEEILACSTGLTDQQFDEVTNQKEVM